LKEEEKVYRRIYKHEDIEIGTPPRKMIAAQYNYESPLL